MSLIYKFRFTILRRITQIAILSLFAVAYYKSIKLLVGNLSSSLLFNTIPLADPFATLQIALAGGALGSSVIIGAIIVICIYASIAPRMFCGWVCPVNIISDTANFLRTKLGFSKESTILNIKRNTRYYMLLVIIVLSTILKIPVFESVNYIAIIHRGIIFGGTTYIAIIICLLLFDIFVLKRGICGYICPLGAFYAIISKYSIIRIYHNADNCTKCAKCLYECPENHIMDIIGEKSGHISDSECISCGRCIQACDDNALKFNIRNLRSK